MIDFSKLSEFLEIINGTKNNVMGIQTSKLSDEHKTLLINWYIKENSIVNENDSQTKNANERLDEINKREFVDIVDGEKETELEQSSAVITEMGFSEFKSTITDEPIRILDFQNLKDIYDVIQRKGFKILKIELDKDELYDKIVEK